MRYDFECIVEADVGWQNIYNSIQTNSTQFGTLYSPESQTVCPGDSPF